MFRFLRRFVIGSSPKIITFLWSIWKLRNKMIFNHIPFSPNMVFSKAIHMYTEWSQHSYIDSLDSIPTSASHNSLSRPVQYTRFVKWEKPPPRIINF